jgi:hypothetical protein
VNFGGGALKRTDIESESIFKARAETRVDLVLINANFTESLCLDFYPNYSIA